MRHARFILVRVRENGTVQRKLCRPPQRAFELFRNACANEGIRYASVIEIKYLPSEDHTLYLIHREFGRGGRRADQVPEEWMEYLPPLETRKYNRPVGRPRTKPIPPPRPPRTGRIIV